MMTLHYLTPTGMSDLEYCETGRLFHINKLMPNHGKTTAPTVIGKFEHTVIEQFYKLTKIDWKELDSFENDKPIQIQTTSNGSITTPPNCHNHFAQCF